MKHSIEEGSSKITLEFSQGRFHLTVQESKEDDNQTITNLTSPELSIIYLLIEAFDRRGFSLL